MGHPVENSNLLAGYYFNKGPGFMHILRAIDWQKACETHIPPREALVVLIQEHTRTMHCTVESAAISVVLCLL